MSNIGKVDMEGVSVFDEIDRSMDDLRRAFGELVVGYGLTEDEEGDLYGDVEVEVETWRRVCYGVCKYCGLPIKEAVALVVELYKQQRENVIKEMEQECK